MTLLGPQRPTILDTGDSISVIGWQWLGHPVFGIYETLHKEGERVGGRKVLLTRDEAKALWEALGKEFGEAGRTET